MGDLKELMRRAAVRPTARPPLRQIERRARRRMWLGRLSIGTVAILIPIGLLLVPGFSDLVTNDDTVGRDRRPDEPKKSRVVIASGRFDPAIGRPLGGEQWELVVWDQSEERFCWNVSVDGEEQNTNCGPRDLPSQSDGAFRGWGYNKLDGGGGSTQVLAMGEIREDVESVEFRFRNGENLQAQVIQPPADLDISTRFFVAALPELQPGHVAGLDGSGEVLATRGMRVQDDCGDRTDRVSLTPRKGPLGTRVQMRASCFYQKNLSSEEAGYFALIGDVNGCELIVGVEGNFRVKNRELRGWFRISEYEGTCFQEPDAEPVPMTPGRYHLVLDCHACAVATFRVTP
ncbi:MAG: hypothetical protein ACRDK3_16990 [Actinomycetota bacterium]